MEYCNCPKDEISVVELNVCCPLHFGLPIHTVCGKRRSMMSRELGVGGFARGVSQSLKIPLSIGYLGYNSTEKLEFDNLADNKE